MSILENVNNIAELRALPEEQLPELCSEIRTFLIESLSKTGGHLASNLGTVELTVALDRVYDPYRDRIVFDVGHQCYTHKLLTGRREGFEKLRKYGGISGFPKPSESEADAFIAGHASNSVSVALGMTRARTRLGGDYDVVAVIGDGALTGGLAYEGLSNAGQSGEPLVVILNDNAMSIGSNVGGMARLLSRMRVKPGYFAFKRWYRSTVGQVKPVYDIAHRVKEGVKGVHGTAVLFIFSVLFFGVMTDAGMFDKIIGALMKKVGNNVVGVALMTCLIAIIGHLDGGGASTFLITIPAMLPVYKRLHMRRETLLLICVTAMGVMNLMPWGGPTMRAASVIEVEPNDLWFQLMPMQVVGLVLAVGTAIFWGLQEKKRIAKLGDSIVAEDAGKYDDSDDGKKDEALARPQNFIFNVILTLAVIIVLVLDIFPSYYVFMVGCALGILVNYRGKKLHNSIIKSHASAGLSMASTILCAGVFLGVLSKSGIMEKMAVVMASFIPASMGRFLPIIIGVLSVPLALLFDTDSYFYGLLPVLVSVGNQFGVNPAHIAIAMVVCRNCATFISPVAPATYLGIGLAGVEIKDHIKYCFGWQWGVSIVCLIAGLILGVIHF